MISCYRGMIPHCVALFVFIVVSFALPPAAAGQGLSEPGTREMQMPPGENPSLFDDEDILIQAKDIKTEPAPQSSSWVIQAGGALPIYDEDFRDFFDWGASVAVGMKRKVSTHLSFTPQLGFILLRGDWDMSESRESWKIEEIIYNESSYMGGGEATVTSSEFLRQVDLDTTMYIVPLTLNLTLQLHDEDERKINPYLGAGVGFCVARRDTDSTVLKEKSYTGPNYHLEFKDSQTVTGQVFQLFAGLEIPFGESMKIVAEAGTVLFDLKRFDPVVSISYTLPNPSSYEGSEQITWSLEDEMQIGVFREEFITTFSLGLVVPF